MTMNIDGTGDKLLLVSQKQLILLASAVWSTDRRDISQVSICLCRVCAALGIEPGTRTHAVRALLWTTALALNFGFLRQDLLLP